MTPDTPPSPGAFETVMLWVGLIGAWLAGEGLKAPLAGAAGGLVRWLMSEKKRVREGIVSVITGSLMAEFATPLTLAILESWVGEMKGDASYGAAFFTGIVGMSMGKLVLAYIEGQHRKFNGEPDA